MAGDWRRTGHPCSPLSRVYARRVPGIAFCSSDWSTEILADDDRPIPGGAGWYRCHLPAYWLHEHGWDVVHVPHVAYVQLRDGRHRLLPIDFDGESFATDWVPDIVVLQRWMGDMAADVIRKCVASGQVIVQDVDDNFDAMTGEHQGWMAVSERAEFGINREQARRSLRVVPDSVNDLRAMAGLPQLVGRNTTTRNNRTHYREALRESSAVVVSTPYLADVLQNVNPYVYVVRNAIDLHRWTARSDADDKAGDRPAFGWVGAVPYRQGDLQVIRGTIARFVEASGKRFVHGGHIEGGPLAADALGIPPEQVRTRPIAPIDKYPMLFTGIGVGLAPLASNSFSAAKCLDQGTRVATKRGVLPIGEVQEGDFVWNGSWQRVRATSHELARPGLEITTELGRVLRLSPEHRLWSDGQWVIAGELQPGDPLSLVQGGLRSGSPEVRPWPAESRMSRAYRHEPLDFSEAIEGPMVTISPRWGRLLGLFVGDGSARATVVSITCDAKDGDVVERIVEDYAAVGLRGLVRDNSTWSGDVLAGSKVINVSNTHLVRFLASLGLSNLDARPGKKGDGARWVRVPEVIWRSPKEVVAAFLSGLFEADGTVGRASCSLTTNQHALALDVQVLLGMLGISALVSPKYVKAYPDRTYWGVSIRRAAIPAFAKTIRFLSIRKNAILDEIASRPKHNGEKPHQWADPVVTVRPCWIVPVDIEVEGEAFSAAGILSHNSAVKLTEMCAAGIPFVASRVPEYEWFVAGWADEYLCSKPVEWQRALKRLMDPDERNRMRALGLERVKRDDIEVRGQDWADLFAAFLAA